MNDIVTTKNVIPLAQINKFEDFIAAPAVRERIAAVLPQHLNPERMMRTIALAAYKNPKLREVHMMSLLGAVMTCASMGFEPNTPLGHAYLIPFEKKKYNRATKTYDVERVDVNVVFGYPGLIDLARRTGSLVSITAKIVHAGDEWSYEYGSSQHLRHRPVGRTEGRKPTHAYAYAKLTDGEAFEVLPYEEALAFRRYSQSWQTAQRQIEDAEKGGEKDAWKARSAAETPWIKHEAQMVMKTMIRRLSTWLPKNIEFARAMAVEGLADAGKIDFTALADLPPADAKEVLEAGAVPEQTSDVDDAPVNRPEREDAKKGKAKPAAKAQSAADTAAARAAREKSATTSQESETSTGTVDPSTGEVTTTTDTDSEPSEALTAALAALKGLKYDEIPGARAELRKQLTAADYSVWQGAALERERQFTKR